MTWHNESIRHQMSAYGLKTTTKGKKNELEGLDSLYSEDLELINQILTWDKDENFELDLINVDESYYPSGTQNTIINVPVIRVEGDYISFVDKVLDKISTNEIETIGFVVRFVQDDEYSSILMFEDWYDGCIPQNISDEDIYGYIRDEEEIKTDEMLNRIPEGWIYFVEHRKSKSPYGQYSFFATKDTGEYILRRIGDVKT